MSKKKAPLLEEKIAFCQGFTQLWARFFNFFGDGFEGRKITADGEAQFFRAMQEVARREYRLSYFIGRDFKHGPRILDILSEAVSLTNLHEMSEAQFSKFQHEWHVVFIALNKCLGRLIEQRPVPKPGKGAPPGAAKQQTAAQQKGSPPKPPQQPAPPSSSQ